MEHLKAIQTPVQLDYDPIIAQKRVAMIEEAIGWQGTEQKPNMIEVNKLSDGSSAYFKKPGALALKENTSKPHDMLPVVGDIFNKPSFQDIWFCLCNISHKNKGAFLQVNTLIYRNAYLLDHIKIGASYRYRPNDEIMLCIEELDGEIGHHINITKNEKKYHLTLWDLLIFLDMLGWNEDVSYQTRIFPMKLKTSRSKTIFANGRINTMLSCIRAPYEVLSFKEAIVYDEHGGKGLDYMPMCKLMQDLMKSQGICPASQQQIEGWLRPYVFRKDMQARLDTGGP